MQEGGGGWWREKKYGVTLSTCLHPPTTHLHPLVYIHPPHTYRDKCPGQKECDAAIDSLNATINQLDQAVLAAMSQQLQPYASSTLQGFQVRVFVLGGVHLCWTCIQSSNGLSLRMVAVVY